MTGEQLDLLTARLGRPDQLRGEFECAPSELAKVRSSQKNRRAHDLTFFLTDPAGRLATIAKPSLPPGVYRAPSGGASPGEELLDAAAREVLEELGVEAAFDRYLPRCEAVFTVADDRVTWTSHVLVGRAAGHDLATQVPDEIREVRWSTPDELAGPTRSAMLALERGLIGCRVALIDAVLARWARAAPRRRGRPAPGRAHPSRGSCNTPTRDPRTLHQTPAPGRRPRTRPAGRSRRPALPRRSGGGWNAWGVAQQIAPRGTVRRSQAGGAGRSDRWGDRGPLRSSDPVQRGDR